ncbi:GNAT family N-acetyltransferase [Nocardia otitidiscaviarum]|uniref:GNAT family N-acetyltransferase n=1 Tax=Nocardia otitidiscaviarum TaxID=1823 RepID=A0A378Y7G4_9NOCA|nr:MULTISPECIES: GNAT family protein [Nocardia]MBF6131746.1 GNAT family N-acetyltransferase [Nocardia otitidiscaviarum]MBF6178188.1 GNAT family N-acetyltransferase [Nocardia otitidiscaviarum]MBF6238404.1 GNAT family N-acetyltransferase [Nocardia otitidiscaviarum]MBF6482877.1 GNAT family N-acetyltransferase [Nocardia otitidiscaviarum]MCP9623176.1 GNAT family N-acetyltransferase [Nocardia otitidiscaviarum]
MPVPVILDGRVVRLEPLAPQHAPGIAEAAADNRDDFAFTPVPHGVDEAIDYIAQAVAGHAAGTSLAFAIVAAGTGRVLGSTRFTRFDYWQGPVVWPLVHGLPPGDPLLAIPDAAEIGNTWLAPDARGAGINLESKLLLLAHAFEVWRVRRIALRADMRNLRSRMAIERLGATSDGVRRAHSRGLDGEVRSTAFYSILDEEWPLVRATIERQLASPPATRRGLIDA